MSYRKKISAFIGIVLLSIAISYYLGPKYSYVSEPLVIWGVVILPLLLLMLFLPTNIIASLKKFSLIYIPVVIFLLAVAPTSNTDIYGLDRELIAWFTSTLFLIISLLIIGWKSWKLRGK
ncbi:MAG: hypothetical protein NUV49_00825 [Patescibacteria group bacterium]|nr:hypothetical protein [Patescibacteria group bacterium]